MGNMYKKSAFFKLTMQCFSANFSWRNVFYCAMVHARSKIKHYNLRTAQETITNL